MSKRGNDGSKKPVSGAVKRKIDEINNGRDDFESDIESEEGIVDEIRGELGAAAADGPEKERSAVFEHWGNLRPGDKWSRGGKVDPRLYDLDDDEPPLVVAADGGARPAKGAGDDPLDPPRR